jgi:transposase
MELPKWVLKHKKKGTEVRRLNGRYYLYKISSRWDPGKRRAKKVTEKFLGTITEDGMIKPRHERMKESMKNVSVKEFGATAFLLEACGDVADALRKEYPEEWRRIFTFSAFRLMHNSPLKNLRTHYNGSYLSETLGRVPLSPKVMGKFLRELGKEREKMKRFMKNFVEGTKFAVIDTTHVFSLSEGIITAVTGHNSRGECLPQTRLLLVHSLDRHMPAYFRMLQGDITDVTAVPLTVKEAGIENAVLIGDKGFYSDGNVKVLEESGIKYVLPVSRNLSLANYRPFMSADRTRLDGHFFFENRVIWHCSRTRWGRKVITYLDPKLKAEEERDFLLRVDKKKGELDEFGKKQHMLGTITVVTDCQESPEHVFGLLKRRVEVEFAFNAFKNTINADRTYMRDDFQLEGWMFVNFVSLIMYYRIYGLLLGAGLLKRYSPKDVILHLSRVFRLRMGDGWVLSEVPKKPRVILERLGMENILRKNGGVKV